MIILKPLECSKNIINFINGPKKPNYLNLEYGFSDIKAPRSPENEEHLVVIQASSAGFNGGNFARMTINEVPVDLEPNVNGHYRGLHVVIINPNSGEIVKRQVFDTYRSSEIFENDLIDSE